MDTPRLVKISKLVVFAVDAAAMYQAGYTFYCSDNGVWLVDAVPPEYLHTRRTREKDYS
jgi:RNA:NAD 2'-phosphotransferase (TPT1/KptA family)